MSELEKPDPQPLEQVPVKASQKLARFLSYHLEGPMLDELPWVVRTPFKTILTWVKKHEREMLDTLGDDQLDTFLAQYADVMLQLRSDDAISMRVIGFASPEDAAALDYFLSHRDEIAPFIEKAAAVSDGERPAELPEGDGPGESQLELELDDERQDHDEDDVGNYDA